jgi:phenylpropionate dioxygenase-like ring-hydroxylating dioxygenase large terminal subunit
VELATTLKTQSVRAGVREVGINANHWYPLGWADQLQPGQVMLATVWQQEMAVYRDADGQLHALENVCPHKGVSLHKGKVLGNHLACRYHGWEFNGEGNCVNIPYLPKTQKLPCAKVRPFPIREKYNLIWVFPGDDTQADEGKLPEVPEYGQAGWLDVPVTAYFKSHFSICNENSMDVFHGFLHEHQQGWFDPVLLKLQETDEMVVAEYQVSYKGWIAKFLGLSDRADEVTTLPITIRYHYPHYASNLQGVSSLYLMRLPVGPTESRSFALFFFRVRLPHWLLDRLKPGLRWLLQRFMLYRFLDQDIEMMESEQQNYLANPKRRYVEINPAIIAVQRLIVRQYEQYTRSANPFAALGHKESAPAVYGSISSPPDRANPL